MSASSGADTGAGAATGAGTATGAGASTTGAAFGDSSTTPTISRPGGGAPRRPPRAPPREPMPRGAGALATGFGAFAASCFASCSETAATSCTGATSHESPRLRRSITSASWASCRIRVKLRSFRLSLSRPSSAAALSRTASMAAGMSFFTVAATDLRTRSNASLRVRRSPTRPMVSRPCAARGVSPRGISGAGATMSGVAARGVSLRAGRSPRPERERSGRVRSGRDAGAASTATSSVGDASGATTSPSIATTVASMASAASAGASVPSVGTRASRSRPPRPRPRPRRRREPRSSPSSFSAASSSAPATSPLATAGEVPALLPGGAISNWPFSSRVSVSSPFCAASCTNFENFDMPRSFSSKPLSMSCMTCLRRSARMTSPLRTMRASDSVTSSHGSRLTVSSSLVFTRPARAL